MGFSMNDDTWDELFRKETDRNGRRQILKKAAEEELLTKEEEALRTRFMDARYDQIKDQKIDYFIRGFARMNMLRGKETKGRMRRFEEKTIREALDDWQYELAQENGELGQQVWYDELYNTSCLYIELCEEDKRYNAVFLGFGRMNDTARVEKIASELREMMYVIPARFGLEKEFSVFVRAAFDAFADQYPERVELLK